MITHKIINLLIALAFLAGLALPVLAATQTSDINNALNGLTNTAVDAKIINSASDTGLNSYQILGRIMYFVLGILGVIFLGIAIFAGIQWMTAGGNEEKASLAITLISRATIGLIIIIAAFLLTNYVILKAINITKPL